MLRSLNHKSVQIYPINDEQELSNGGTYYPPSSNSGFLRPLRVYSRHVVRVAAWLMIETGGKSAFDPNVVCTLI